MKFSTQELQAFKNATVSDLIGPGVKLLFVGINPGLWTAAAQTHFAHPSNRFYPALRKAGIIKRSVDRSKGMDQEDREYFTQLGVGITNIAPRATAKASELSTQELRLGAEQLKKFVQTHTPQVVAIAGITAYRTAFRDPKAQTGKQPGQLAGAELWVVPNPSGLNAHETTSTLAAAYAEPAKAAGIICQ